jgi:ABC-type phosphate/phosphonate transport system substrate-binding protein
LRLYIDRSAAALGSKPDSFFSSIAPSDNVEDALDDVVDGKAQATIIDQAALDAYKRRKPGRFNQLKEIGRSQPFPPLIVAYYDSYLDETTLRRFKAGLLNAVKKDKGEMLLTLSRLSGFEAIPADFSQALEASRKNYPKDIATPMK